MSALAPFLDQLHRRYHDPRFLSSDPLEIAHRYSDPWDQECVALLAAVLAYGNVKQIRRSVEDALQRMGRRVGPAGPAAFVRGLRCPREIKNAQLDFQGFVHRFNRGEDLVSLFRLLERSWREHGSLGAHFLRDLAPADEDIGFALDRLIGEWREWEAAFHPGETSRTFSYLLTSPRDGSCCKRWCMFLRWMGRKDLLDLGLWDKSSPLASTFPAGRSLRTDQLIIPLDTHTGRISQYLGLTPRKSLNWKAAVEVTRSLRLCDPADPTRFDFALSRLGILDLCQRAYRAEVCRNCELLTVCRYAKAGAIRENARQRSRSKVQERKR